MTQPDVFVVGGRAFPSPVQAPTSCQTIESSCSGSSEDERSLRTSSPGHVDAAKALGLRKGARNRTLGVWGLTGLIFYAVSGGPFGIEASVGFAGPLLTILGFVVFAAVWAVPEALLTAELGSAMPHNAGACVWVTAAFGERAGFMNAWLSWVSGIVDAGIYPALLVSYVKELWMTTANPAVSSEMPFVFAIDVLVFYLLPIVLGAMNLAGIQSVSEFLSSTMVVVLLPFVIMFFLALPRMHAGNWLAWQAPGHKIDWIGCLHICFWNLNYWDSIGTVAGEVKAPQKTIPKALALSVALVELTYLIPILTAVGVDNSPRRDFSGWTSGKFVETAHYLGGAPLSIFLTISSVFSNVSLLHCDRYENKVAATRTQERGAPVFAIVCCTVCVLIFSSWNFVQTMAFANTTYALSMLLEFAAFVNLRKRLPNMRRPFAVPLSSVTGCVLMLFPAGVLCVVLVCAPLFNLEVANFVCTAVVVALGFAVHVGLAAARSSQKLRFARDPPGALESVYSRVSPRSRDWTPMSNSI